MLVVALLILAVWTSPQPPEITVQFLGITNVAPNRQEAWFELHNAGSIPTEVWLPGIIEVNNLPLIWSGFQMSSNITMRPGASLKTSLVPPVTRDRWRADFFCPIPLNFIQKSKNFVAARGLRVTQSGPTAISVDSGWLNPTLETDAVIQVEPPVSSTNSQP